MLVIGETFFLPVIIAFKTFFEFKFSIDIISPNWPSSKAIADVVMDNLLFCATTNTVSSLFTR